LLLSNQYLILEALYPKDAKSYARCREAIECGYELEYKTISQHVYNDEDTLSESECNEVLDILCMFDELGYWYGEVKDKEGVDKGDITFEGFDGNDSQEVKYLAFARYICEGSGKPFSRAIKKPTDLYNSHIMMLPVYRRMSEEWKRTENKRQLDKKDILRIIGARAYPTNR